MWLAQKTKYSWPSNATSSFCVISLSSCRPSAPVYLPLEEKIFLEATRQALVCFDEIYRPLPHQARISLLITIFVSFRPLAMFFFLSFFLSLFFPPEWCQANQALPQYGPHVLVMSLFMDRQWSHPFLQWLGRSCVNQCKLRAVK